MRKVEEPLGSIWCFAHFSLFRGVSPSLHATKKIKGKNVSELYVWPQYFLFCLVLSSSPSRLSNHTFPRCSSTCLLVTLPSVVLPGPVLACVPSLSHVLFFLLDETPSLTLLSPCFFPVSVFSLSFVFWCLFKFDISFLPFFVFLSVPLRSKSWKLAH